MLANHFDKVAGKHHHGIVIPLSALHSEKGSGIGEILDLLILLPWMEKIGFDTLQLLPLTDSGEDSSPYNAHTSTAINPIFLSLKELPYRKEEPPHFKIEGRLNYPEIRKGKLEWIKRYLKEAQGSLREEKDYALFLEKNPNIFHYAKFAVLKEKNNEKPWWDWTEQEANEEEVKENVLIQYLLDQQLKKVAEEASKRGIYLLGDGPILLNRDSVECLEYPQLFLDGSTVGAPPDYYSQEGQGWGFPPYHWEEIHKENYVFIKDRLEAAEKFFSMYRMDHIVGFFRLWIIPEGKIPKEGHFIPSQEEEWYKQGTYLLRLFLDRTNMILFGEDLGDIPPRVREIMKELNIPGTRVMRWERDWHHGAYFIQGKDYEPLSLTTVSTHDSETLGEWWTLYPHDALAFSDAFRIPFEETLTPALREKILLASHQTASLFHINPLQEYLSLEGYWSFEDPKEERINVPGTISPFNWTFRVKPSLEEFTSHPEFIEKMKSFSKAPAPQ